MALGLNVIGDSTTFWRKNVRRALMMNFPNGAAPLAAILSLAASDEATPLSTIQWTEERVQQISALTMTGPTANNVFYGTGTTVSSGTTVTPTLGTTYRIYIAAAETTYQTDDIVRIAKLPLAAGGTTAVSFRVVSTGTNFIEGYALNTASGAVTNNASTVVGLVTQHYGTAFAESSKSRAGRYEYPILVSNYTQIFKDSFELTRHALKAPLDYNASSDYQKQLKRAGINHMIGIETSMLFGERTSVVAADEYSSGRNVRRTTMGGVLYFLKQWELGNTGNGGEFDYRPGGANLTSQTDFLTYPDKRVINLNDGTITTDAFEEMEALPFARVNTDANEKLCLCGSGYMAKINAKYRKELQIYKLPGEAMEKWECQLAVRITPTGTIYYKTHPLFNQPNSPYRNSAFYLDVGLLQYIPFTDSDTQVIPNVQERDHDKRKDMYMTECTLEVQYPEANMFVQDLGGITL